MIFHVGGGPCAMFALCAPCRYHKIQSPEGMTMSMNKDQVEGLKKKVSGKINAVAGKLVGNKEMEAKGKATVKVGKAQVKLGDAKAAGKKTAY